MPSRTANMALRAREGRKPHFRSSSTGLPFSATPPARPPRPFIPLQGRHGTRHFPRFRLRPVRALKTRHDDDHALHQHFEMAHPVGRGAHEGMVHPDPFDQAARLAEQAACLLPYHGREAPQVEHSAGRVAGRLHRRGRVNRVIVFVLRTRLWDVFTRFAGAKLVCDQTR